MQMIETRNCWAARAEEQAKLTPFLRLTIYSYLDLKETVTKAACLSKIERAKLKESHIARENK